MIQDAAPRRSPGPKAVGKPRFFFNPKDPAFNGNPYLHYKRLREEDPVHWSFMNVWFIGRYADVRQVLKDKRFSAQDIPSQLERKNELLAARYISDSQPPTLGNLIKNARNWFAFLEPPDHTRLRRLVTNAFHVRTIEGMRPYIRRCATGLIEKVRPQGHMDMMKDFAPILALNVIATMLGVPRQDFPKLLAWTERLARIFDPLMSLEELATLDRASLEFMEYLTDLIAARRGDPQDDLISALIAARDEGDRLSEEELVSVCILLFGAGEETVVNLMGNGSLALMRNPEQRQYLIEHPELMEDAIEELLRYDAPLQMTSRTALADVEVGGKTIKQGDQMYVVLGSANRDPERFDEPDTLRLDRQSNHHMAFADGHHLCVGAMLARAEGQEAFRVLLEMVPDMQLATDQLHWRDHTVLRGMTSLPVTFTARG